MDKKLDLVRIQKSSTTNAGLSRATGSRPRSRAHRRVDEVAELAQLTRMDYAFAPICDSRVVWYGVAVLSRLPILATDHRRYQNTANAERRGFNSIEVDNHGQLINFVTTIWIYQYEDGRIFETEQLMKSLAQTSAHFHCRRFQRRTIGHSLQADPDAIFRRAARLI